MMEYSNSGITFVINEYVHSARDRSLLLMRYVDGMTYEQIAEKLDLSVRQVQNIHYKFQQKVLLKHKDKLA